MPRRPKPLTRPTKQPSRATKGRVYVPASAIAPMKQVPTRPVYEKRGPGRPSLLTPEVTERLLFFLRAGVGLDTSAVAVGLSPKTVEEWLYRGRGTDNRPAGAQYVEFAKLVAEAKANSKALVEANLMGLTRTHPQAAIFYLTRKYPKEWGPLTASDFPMLTTGETGPVNIDARQQVLIIDPTQYPEFTSKLLAQRRATMPDDPVILDEVPEDTRDSAVRAAGLREDAMGDDG